MSIYTHIRMQQRYIHEYKEKTVNNHKLRTRTYAFKHTQNPTKEVDFPTNEISFFYDRDKLLAKIKALRQ